MNDQTRSTNRLARESSPYLLLHAHNPVDWYPWGAEAIARARDDDKPIFLSVGYSTCYWCHVMERESFSDPGIAEQLNRNFVCVKVDREERPDLDELYMLATQILAGQGGWPNSVFLTPALEPFFAGTYFPPADLHDRPGFPTILHSMLHAWHQRRAEVEQQAGELAQAIRHHLEEIEPWKDALPGRELLEQAFKGLRKRFDPTWGGFGQQPKFPTPSNLWLLAALAGESAAASMMLSATLDGMARGGLFDQLGGGFHRYATDREWRVPHFEKMLYDNGLLLELYAREGRRAGNPDAERVALATADWLDREMSAPEGGFWSAIDAETEGHEGAFYVWRRDELEAALGPEDATFLAPLLGFDGEPFFEQEAYVLHLPRPLEVQARERHTTRHALLEEIEPLRAKLLDARSRRPRPATDDKILTDWNGTAIAGLAVAGRELDRPDLVARAVRAAEFLLGASRSEGGTLLHAWRAGAGKIAAFLSDYVFLVRGLLRLHEATGERRWLDEAIRLQEEQARRLESPRGGYFNAAEAEDLLFRAKEIFDGAMPSANGVAALNLLDLHAATGERRWLEEAERTLRAFVPLVATHPDGARTLSLALSRFAEQKDKGHGGVRDKDGKASIEGMGVVGASVESRETRFRETTGEADSVNQAADNAPSTVTPSMESFLSFAKSLLEELHLESPRGEGGSFEPFVLTFRVRAGWSLVVEEGLPRLEGSGATLEGVEWPPQRPLTGAVPDPVKAGFSGAIEVRGQVRTEAPRAALILRFLACGDGRCLPAAEVEIPLP